MQGSLMDTEEGTLELHSLKHQSGDSFKLCVAMSLST
jgi:hypothetical protein